MRILPKKILVQVRVAYARTSTHFGRAVRVRFVQPKFSAKGVAEEPQEVGAQRRGAVDMRLRGVRKAVQQ